MCSRKLKRLVPLVHAAAIATAFTLFSAMGAELRLLAHDPLGGTDAAISADGRHIATSSRRDGESHLWIYDVETKQWSQLTEGEGEDSEPQWSPDGKYLAFTSTRRGGKNIWILRLADRTLRQLTFSGEENEYPNWSPDGKILVFTGGPWKARKFYLVRFEGGEPKPISDTPDHVGACSFFPDGHSVVCHSYRAGVGMVERLALDGTLIARLTDGHWDYKPTTTPDGNHVVFSRHENLGVGIWSIPIGGGTALPLVQSFYQDRWPMFTRAGELFFHRVIDRGGSVHVLDVRTRKATLLADRSERPRQAAFSPDGRRVAYCVESEGGVRIRILDRVTGVKRDLDFAGMDACFPRYSPAGETIAALVRTEGKWKIATRNVDRGPVKIWGVPPSGAKIFEGPIDWSPDGTRMAFAAQTAPYESDIFILDLRSGQVQAVTEDSWYDEAPAWSADGKKLAFMSTRGGSWTWGLFLVSLEDRRIEQFVASDHLEKNFPRLSSGLSVWTQFDRCIGVSVLALRTFDGPVSLVAEYPGAIWPSFSVDQREILFTVLERDVQYWLRSKLRDSTNDGRNPAP